MNMTEDEIIKCEKTRESYKPEKIKFLFIGESIPDKESKNGDVKFFYYGNSDLFKYTKQTFEFLPEFKSTKDFLNKFKESGCWLYDVCDKPNNSKELSDYERKNNVENSSKKLLDIIKYLNPKIVIVIGVAKKYGMKNIYEKAIPQQYVNNITKFNVYFPNNGYQNEYVNHLSKILKQINI